MMMMMMMMTMLMVMVFHFHTKFQVDKMTHLDKKKIRTNGSGSKDFDYFTLHFQTPVCIIGLSGVADHPDPINYCMASNLGYKTNKKQQKDMEIRWKQQYDIEQN